MKQMIKRGSCAADSSVLAPTPRFMDVIKNPEEVLFVFHTMKGFLLVSYGERTGLRITRLVILAGFLEIRGISYCFLYAKGIVNFKLSASSTIKVIGNVALYSTPVNLTVMNALVLKP